MKILVDMNLSPRWIVFLADAGFSAVHWSTLRRINARDEEIMAWASANHHVVLTHDLDFSSILAATKGTRPSVVQIRSEDVNPDVIGHKVVSAMLQMEQELMGGALVSVDPNRARVRVLPLGR